MWMTASNELKTGVGTVKGRLAARDIGVGALPFYPMQQDAMYNVVDAGWIYIHTRTASMYQVQPGTHNTKRHFSTIFLFTLYVRTRYIV